MSLIVSLIFRPFSDCLDIPQRTQEAECGLRRGAIQLRQWPYRRMWMYLGRVLYCQFGANRAVHRHTIENDQ